MIRSLNIPDLEEAALTRCSGVYVCPLSDKQGFQVQREKIESV